MGPFTDNENRKYYVNSLAGVSSWQDPRIDAQYTFELQSGLLTSLEEVLPTLAFPDEPNGGAAGDNCPWRSAEGAEVLTLDGPECDSGRPPATASSVRSRREQKRLEKRPTRSEAVIAGLAKKTAKEEAKTTLDKMVVTAENLHSLKMEDEEIQRLQFAKKVEERRLRRLAAKCGGVAASGGSLPPPPASATIASPLPAPAAPLPGRVTLAPLLPKLDNVQPAMPEPSADVTMVESTRASRRNSSTTPPPSEVREGHKHRRKKTAKEKFECEFGCGFVGSFAKCQLHEKLCKLNPATAASEAARGVLQAQCG
jgi:hypothetical protein